MVLGIFVNRDVSEDFLLFSFHFPFLCKDRTVIATIVIEMISMFVICCQLKILISQGKVYCSWFIKLVSECLIGHEEFVNSACAIEKKEHELYSSVIYSFIQKLPHPVATVGIGVSGLVHMNTTSRVFVLLCSCYITLG